MTSSMQGKIQIIPVHHIPEIKHRDNLASLIVVALEKQKISFEDHDIVVITQKIVSKSEGRIIDLDTIAPSASALEIAKKYTKDPRYIELVLRRKA